MWNISPRTEKLLTWFSIILGLYLLFVGINLYANRAGLAQYFDYRRGIEREQALREKDTYGGKTPQETLRLFIEALSKNDIALAARYFEPDRDGAVSEWQAALTKAADERGLAGLITALKKAEPEPDGIIGDRFYAFAARNDEGVVTVDISLSYNGFVWKISSL